jgi:hypothetical protein
MFVQRDGLSYRITAFGLLGTIAVRQSSGGSCKNESYKEARMTGKGDDWNVPFPMPG